jgi:hypothetical protein
VSWSAECLVQQCKSIEVERVCSAVVSVGLRSRAVYQMRLCVWLLLALGLLGLLQLCRAVEVQEDSVHSQDLLLKSFTTFYCNSTAHSTDNVAKDAKDAKRCTAAARDVLFLPGSVEFDQSVVVANGACSFLCPLAVMRPASVCPYVCMSVCLYVCMSVCLYVCMSVCLYVCMSVCLYVCMCVCLYV